MKRTVHDDQPVMTYGAQVFIMSKYRTMVKEAREQHEQREREQAEQREQERKARSEYVDRAVATLERYVLPKLREAESEFLEESIESRVETDFDVKSFISRDPSVTFRGIGPKRKSDGWQFHAPAVFIVSDGGTITVGAGNNSTDREPKTTIGKASAKDSAELIDAGIKRALELYYEELENSRHLLNIKV